MLNPNDAVARIQSIVIRNKPTYTPGVGVKPGQFYRAAALFANNLARTAITQSTQVYCLVFRNDQVAIGHENMLLALKDRIVVGPGTLAAVEFLIGGRVGINASTQVVVNSERSVVDVDTPAGRTFINSMVVLFKLDAKALKQPLEIQTNGGTMGIKG